MGILLAAAIATVASLLIIGGGLAWRSNPSEWRVLAFLILLQLPISPLVFYSVTVPLDWFLERSIANEDLRGFLSLLHRSLVLELAKLWPLLLPSVWQSTTAEKSVLRGMALGLGFGIGEIWLNAATVYRTMPVVANLPVVNLAGFINERIMVCAIHGVQTAVALQRLIWGILFAVGLHTLGNLPFYLQKISAFGLLPNTWVAIVRFWVLWYFFAMMVVLWIMSGGDLHLVWLLFGDATCPYCGMIYPRATLTWSLRVIHHDHCPRCKAKNIMHG